MNSIIVTLNYFVPSDSNGIFLAIRKLKYKKMSSASPVLLILVKTKCHRKNLLLNFR